MVAKAMEERDKWWKENVIKQYEENMDKLYNEVIEEIGSEAIRDMVPTLLKEWKEKTLVKMTEMFHDKNDETREQVQKNAVKYLVDQT